MFFSGQDALHRRAALEVLASLVWRPVFHEGPTTRGKQVRGGKSSLKSVEDLFLLGASYISTAAGFCAMNSR